MASTEHKEETQSVRGTSMSRTISAAIPVLVQVASSEDMASILARGMALEALRLIRAGTGTAYPALPK